LKAVNRWIVEGGKATLAGAPDEDILAAAIEILRKRIAAGTATIKDCTSRIPNKTTTLFLYEQ